MKRFYAYVVTHDGNDLTKELVRHGYSTAFGMHEEYFDGTAGDKLFKQVKELEEEARKKKVGIWKFAGLPRDKSNDATPSEKEPASPEEPIPTSDTARLKEIEGKTAKVSGEVSRVGQTPTGSITFINFQGSEFTGVIFEANLEAVEAELGSSIKEALEGKVVTLQGEISSYKEAPQIKITNRAQIEVRPSP